MCVTGANSSMFLLWLALSIAACGGSTHKEQPPVSDPAAVDGGDTSTSPDGEGGDGETTADAEDGDPPKLDFGAIGKPVLVANRFSFTEGPVWDPVRNVLFFTDIDGSKVYRLTPPDQFEVVIDGAGAPNGLALDRSGRLLVAGFGARNVWRWREPEIDVLADNYQGAKLNSPDDLVVRADGTVYFTDPTYGIDGTNGPKGGAELDFMGVFRIAPDGAIFLEDATKSDPNGASLSPDERTLFVSYTSASEVDAFDIAADGSLSGKRPFASGLQVPDGMTIDRGGNVYIAVLGGITVLGPDGALLGKIAVPQWPANCAFGGVDQKTLFITARNAAGAKAGALYRIDDMPIAGVAGQP